MVVIVTFQVNEASLTLDRLQLSPKQCKLCGSVGTSLIWLVDQTLPPCSGYVRLAWYWSKLTRALELRM